MIMAFQVFGDKLKQKNKNRFKTKQNKKNLVQYFKIQEKL